MYNLYNTSKTFKDTWNNNKCVTMSVARGKGLLVITAVIIQDEYIAKISASFVWRFVKTFIFQNNPGYKGLIAVSVHDRKPVNFYLWARSPSNEKINTVWSIVICGRRWLVWCTWGWILMISTTCPWGMSILQINRRNNNALTTVYIALSDGGVYYFGAFRYSW